MKNDFKKQYLPEETLAVFEYLSTEPLLADFSLIGGTAMSLQVGHRFSEDLDFWLPAKELNKGKINQLIRKAQANGYDAQLAMDESKLSQAKINGIDVLQYSQDYVINSVKVTFFARLDEPYQHFNAFNRLRHDDISFGIMPLDALFEMKSYVISQRTKSRDIFDLYHFVRQGKSVNDIIDAGKRSDMSYSGEYAKLVLTGVQPLSKDDEELFLVVNTISIDNVYGFFRQSINKLEAGIAKKIKSEIQLDDVSDVCSKDDNDSSTLK